MAVIFIFDLDGTLSDHGHRLHYIKREKPDWDAYYAACGDDPPIAGVCRVFRALHAAGNSCLVWSGRRDDTRQATHAWLMRHDLRPTFTVRMRPRTGPLSRVPNSLLKRVWLPELDELRRDVTLAAAFDDDPRTCAMYEECGVPVVRIAGWEATKA